MGVGRGRWIVGWKLEMEMEMEVGNGNGNGISKCML